MLAKVRVLGLTVLTAIRLQLKLTYKGVFPIVI